MDVKISELPSTSGKMPESSTSNSKYLPDSDNYLPEQAKTLPILTAQQVIDMVEKDDAIVVRANKVEDVVLVMTAGNNRGHIYSHFLLFNPVTRTFHWFYNIYRMIKKIGPEIEYFYKFCATRPETDSLLTNLMFTEQFELLDFDNIFVKNYIQQVAEFKQQAKMTNQQHQHKLLLHQHDYRTGHEKVILSSGEEEEEEESSDMQSCVDDGESSCSSIISYRCSNCKTVETICGCSSCEEEEEDEDCNEKSDDEQKDSDSE